MRILLAHMAIPPFTQEALRAFHERDLLDRFCSGLVVKAGDASIEIASMVPGRPGAWLRGLLERRRMDDLPTAQVDRHRYGELLRLLVGRLDRSGILTDRTWDWATHDFDRWCARRLRAGVAAYGYEYGCAALFERARALGVPRCYEIPSAEHDFVHALQDRELARFPELRSSLIVHTSGLQAARTARRRKEYDLSTLAIVYSRHVQETYARAGLDTSRMRVVPLGSPPVVRAPHDGPPDAKGPLRLVWAGTFGIRKGAPYLVEALERFTASEVRVDVYGSFQLPPAWRARLERYGTVHGPVSRGELLERMRAAHALVLPSLSDSFGMVVTEALSVGTPVITTRSVGASDRVVDRTCGRVIEPADTDALAGAMSWMRDSLADLPAMRRAAQAAAAGWQWADFRTALADTVTAHCESFRA